jgi:hypothetical protein
LNIVGFNGFNFRQKDSRLRQRPFSGMVVASADAFYFALDPNTSRQASLFSGSNTDTESGLFGTTDPDVRDVDLSELPTEITGDHDWPLTWKQGPVLIVPRRAVRALRTSRMLGGIELELLDVRILVYSPVFRRLKMAAYLTAVGWEVEGAGGTISSPVRDPDTPAAHAEFGKAARARFVIGTIFILIGMALPIWQWKWIQSAMHGPTPITAADINKLEDPATLENPWVTLRFDNSIETGVESVERGRFSMILGEIRSKYLLIQVRDEWLVARVLQDFQGKEVVGYLDRWWTPLAREKLEEVTTAFPGRDLTPFQLDAAYPYRREAYALIAVSGLLITAGVIAVVLSRIRRRNHSSVSANMNSQQPT